MEGLIFPYKNSITSNLTQENSSENLQKIYSTWKEVGFTNRKK